MNSLHSFWKFSDHLFSRKCSNNCLLFKCKGIMCGLCNLGFLFECRNCSNNCLLFKCKGIMCGLCNMGFLFECRNCWKTLWIDLPSEFISYIPPKGIKRHQSEKIFDAWQNFEYYVFSSFWKCLVLAIIYLNEIYST